MAANTCAACDGALEPKAIRARIGDETVDVCGEACAETLQGARLSAARGVA
jgi:hypothetical protein